MTLIVTRIGDLDFYNIQPWSTWRVTVTGGMAGVAGWEVILKLPVLFKKSLPKVWVGR